MTEEATVFDAKHTRWVVAHEFYHAFDGEDAFVHQIEHRNEGELHKGHATGGFGSSTDFITDAVRSVVCADGADASVGECRTDSRTVGVVFHSWVALDARSETFVVFASKDQVG